MRLARFERRWAQEIGAALMPRDAFGGLRQDLDLGDALAGEIRRATQATALVLRLALWLVWLAPLWRRGRLHTFGALGGAGREALLEELLDSRSYAVRELLMLLKLFFCFRFLGDRRVLAHIGAYDLAEGPQRAPRTIGLQPPRRAAS